MANYTAALCRAGGVLLLSALLTGRAEAQKYSPIHYTVQFGLLSVQRTFSETPVINPATNTVTTGPARDKFLLYGAGLGADIALLHLGAEQSVGLSLNADAAIATSQYTGSGFEKPILVWLPEYVTYRWGARSSRKSQQNFGFGIGAGYRFGYVLQEGYHAPSVMAEGAYVTGRRDLMLRLSTDLGARTFGRPAENPAIDRLQLHFATLSIGATL